MQANWETVHILFAEADRTTGVVTCQVGDVKSGEVYDPQAFMFAGGFGMITLPAPPVAGVSAAEAITLNIGSGNIVIGARSVVSAKRASLIKMGETALYADGSQAVILEKLDGSINLLTTHDNTDTTGRNVCLSVAPDGMRFEWPWSRLKSEKDGLHYDHVSGMLFDMGAVVLSGPFALLSQFSTYCTVRANLVKIETSIMSVGAKSSIKSPVARADAVVAAMNAVSLALTQVGSALTALQTEVAAIAVASQPAASPTTTVGGALSVGIAAAAVVVGEAIASVGAAAAVVTAGAVGTPPIPGPIGARSLAAA